MLRRKGKGRTMRKKKGTGMRLQPAATNSRGIASLASPMPRAYSSGSLRSMSRNNAIPTPSQRQLTTPSEIGNWKSPIGIVLPPSQKSWRFSR